MFIEISQHMVPTCCKHFNGYHNFAKTCKKKQQYEENNKIKKTQEIRVKNKNENVFLVQSVHKLYSIQHK